LPRGQAECGHSKGAREINMTGSLSRHAAVRAQQRSIDETAIELVWAYGATARRHGAEVCFLDRRAREDLMRAVGEAAYARLKPKLDIYVVERSGIALTVAHRLRRIRR
jgi:hypothetical protein